MSGPPLRKATSLQIWLRVGGPILALMLAIISAAIGVFWHLAQKEDRAWASDARQLVRGAIESDEHALTNTALDFAFWNEAYAAITAGWNPRWVKRNFYSVIADGIVVFREDRSVRFAWFSNAKGERAMTMARGVAAAAATDDLLRQAPRRLLAAEMVHSSYALVGDRLALISWAPISPETEAERAAGRVSRPVDYVAAIDLIEAPEWAQLANRLALRDLVFEPARLSPPQDSDLIALPIANVSGHTLGHLTWRDERPGSSRFVNEVWPIAIGLLFVGALAILVTWRLVARQVDVWARAESIVEAGRLKAQFVSMMSHELRSPLTNIIGYAELIHETMDPRVVHENEVRQDAERIRSSAKTLLNLINEVLDYARIDAGHMPLLAERIDVSHAISEIYDIVQPVARAAGNSLSVRIEGEALEAVADPARYAQCLLNLLGNAAKFTRDGSIEILARRTTEGGKSYIAVDVIDTGIGMKASTMDTLFTPFSQAESLEAQFYLGAGLGLTVTRRLARAMGGDVFVASAPKMGSTFTLWIPAAEPAEDAAKQAA